MQGSSTRIQTRPRSLQTEIDNVEYLCDFSSHQYECFHESIDNVKSSSFSVKNSLKKHIKFWRDELHVNVFIDSVITEGYKISFDSAPTSIFCKNNASALKHSNFVDQAVRDLLENGFIKEMQSQPFCTNPLTVSVNSSGKERLILDLRHINHFIHKFEVKFEGCKEALDFCKPGHKMFKSDLKSGYYHVDINEEFHKFLGFSWTLNGKQKFFVYTVMAFNLSSAPYLFTKLLRPLVKYWRLAGISVIVYLDDGWGIDSSAVCEAVSDRVKSDIQKAGFVLNTEKSVLKPCLILEWLGFIWNMEEGSIEIPKLKISKLKKLIAQLFFGEVIASARCLAKVAGKIISMSFSFGNICLIMTRQIQICIINRQNWNFPLTLGQEVVDELSFWFKQLETLPYRALFPLNRKPERIVFVDASDFAGAAVLLSSSNKIARYMFSELIKIEFYV